MATSSASTPSNAKAPQGNLMVNHTPANVSTPSENLKSSNKREGNTDYNSKVKEHFLHPKNMGEMKNPDGVGNVGNPKCGDVMKVEIKVSDGKIKDIKFQTFGCAAAIATSSAMTEIANGKTLDEARKITNNDVAEYLGGLPGIKMHCSNLAADALESAIDDFEKKK